MEYRIENQNEARDKVIQPLSMNPKKFALWLFIISVTMVFAALTSAYIVRMGEGNWLDFQLPNMLWFSTGIIALSSITMHIAYRAAKKDNLDTLKIAMVITSILGVGFLVTQFMSWSILVENNVYFSDPGTPSGSFVYVFTGLHGLHIVSGIIFLLVVLAAVFKYKVHSKKLAQIEMCATYWHFLDGLWIYLFIFLLLNH